MADPPKLTSAVGEYTALADADVAASPLPAQIAQGEPLPPSSSPEAVPSLLLCPEQASSTASTASSSSSRLSQKSSPQKTMPAGPEVGLPVLLSSLAQSDELTRALHTTGVSLLSAVVVKLVDLDTDALDRQISAF